MLAAQSAFLKKTIQTFGSFGTTLILNLFTGILISRGLGPHDKGVYVAIITWSTVLLWIFNVSLYQVTVYYFGKHPELRRTFFTTFMVISFGLGLVACIFGLTSVIPLLIRHGYTGGIFWARLLFLTLPLSTMFQVVNGGLNGSMKFSFTNTVRIALPLVMVLAWSWLYFSHRMGVSNCLEWYVVISTAFYVLGILYAAKERLFGSKFSWVLLRSGLFYGLKAHGSTTADVMNGNLTPILLSIMLPTEYLGYYSTAQSAAGTLNAVSNAVIMTGFSLLSSLDDRETHSTTMRMWRATLSITFPAAVIMALLFPIAVPLVFGRTFSGAVMCAVIMLGSVILSGQAGILRNALNSRGYSLINTTSESIALLFSVGSLLVLSRFFGLDGAALATVIGSIVRVAILLRSYRLHVQRVHLAELIPGPSEMQYLISIMRSLKARALQRA